MEGEPVEPRCFAREIAVPCLVQVACAGDGGCVSGMRWRGRAVWHRAWVQSPSAARSSGRSSGFGHMVVSVRRRYFSARPYVASPRCASWPRAPLTSLPNETAARVVRAEAL